MAPRTADAKKSLPARTARVHYHKHAQQRACLQAMYGHTSVSDHARRSSVRWWPLHAGSRCCGKRWIRVAGRDTLAALGTQRAQNLPPPSSARPTHLVEKEVVGSSVGDEVATGEREGGGVHGSERGKERCVPHARDASIHTQQASAQLACACKCGPRARSRLRAGGCCTPPLFCPFSLPPGGPATHLTSTSAPARARRRQPASGRPQAASASQR